MKYLMPVSVIAAAKEEVESESLVPWEYSQDGSHESGNIFIHPDPKIFMNRLDRVYMFLIGFTSLLSYSFVTAIMGTFKESFPGRKFAFYSLLFSNISFFLAVGTTRLLRSISLSKQIVAMYLIQIAMMIVMAYYGLKKPNSAEGFWGIMISIFISGAALWHLMLVLYRASYYFDMRAIGYIQDGISLQPIFACLLDLCFNILQFSNTQITIYVLIYCSSMGVFSIILHLFTSRTDHFKYCESRNKQLKEKIRLREYWSAIKRIKLPFLRLTITTVIYYIACPTMNYELVPRSVDPVIWVDIINIVSSFMCIFSRYLDYFPSLRKTLRYSFIISWTHSVLVTFIFIINDPVLSHRTAWAMFALMILASLDYGYSSFVQYVRVHKERTDPLFCINYGGAIGCILASFVSTIISELRMHKSRSSA